MEIIGGQSVEGDSGLGDLLDQVEEELSKERVALRFAPRVEEQYEGDTRDAANRVFVAAGLIAVLVSDSFLLSDYFARPEVLERVFWVRMLVTTLPCLAIVAWVARGVHSDVRERLAVVGIWLVSLATALINRWTKSDWASCDVFVFSLVTIAANVLLSVKFKTAVVASVGALLIMGPMVLSHEAIDTGVKIHALMIFASATLSILYPRYQLDSAQRLNYLRALRSELERRITASNNVVLRRISDTDSLTGLANRRRFWRAFSESCAGLSSKGRSRVGILMIDIDHFKAYNDHFGHLAGDRCLKQVA